VPTPDLVAGGGIHDPVQWQSPGGAAEPAEMPPVRRRGEIPAPLWGFGEVGDALIQGLAPLATFRGSSGARRRVPGTGAPLATDRDGTIEAESFA
jgi:hypothetical protein